MLNVYKLVKGIYILERSLNDEMKASLCRIEYGLV